jgi:hypothetical protein
MPSTMTKKYYSTMNIPKTTPESYTMDYLKASSDKQSAINPIRTSIKPIYKQNVAISIRNKQK